jgi:hypothetical protein
MARNQIRKAPEKGSSGSSAKSPHGMTTISPASSQLKFFTRFPGRGTANGSFGNVAAFAPGMLWPA